MSTVTRKTELYFVVRCVNTSITRHGSLIFNRQHVPLYISRYYSMYWRLIHMAIDAVVFFLALRGDIKSPKSTNPG